MSACAHNAGSRESADWVSNRQRSVPFDRAGLERFARELRRRLAGGRSFGVCIASDEALRRANLRYRGINAATDVLSFPADAEDGMKPAGRRQRGSTGWRPGRQPPDEAPSLGEILISARRAQEQARALGHPVDEELKILLLHGLLHLLGHDHERDHGRMERLERKWRRLFSLPAGLIERAGT
jgi:probable rRNA maturation factor